MTLEVIPAADHFQNGWKSIFHFQHVASGRTDAAAVDGITLLALTDWQRRVAIERNTSGIQLLLKSPAGE
ncbi:MAG: hypothetical protein NT138_06145 [Planctomycetales bacterium]|nr:hypothetical protein [Planctomycetales bacterium]